MKRFKYDDEFKLEVVKTYLEGPHGVRVVARSFGLPSKNYIHRWMDELKRKGLLPPETHKSNPKKEKADPYQAKQKSAREKHLITLWT